MGSKMDRNLKEELSGLLSRPVGWDCALRDYTSFAIGGPVTALVTAQDVFELQRVIDLLIQNEVAWRVIGKGTNLLVSDAGFEGVIVLLGEGFNTTIFSDRPDGLVTVKAGSGCTLIKLSSLCIQKGCSGFEFACGIPGNVGGAVIMNAGAWGSELADVITAIEVLTATGVKRLLREQLQFSYRCWLDYLKDPRQIVIGMEIQLKKRDPEVVRKRCLDLLRMRRERQPKGQPNAGSFFKNPKGQSAGYLIEKCGCKGLQVGGAMISPVHANFMVNIGSATAADVCQLMDIVKKKVEEESGVILEPEVHFL